MKTRAIFAFCLCLSLVQSVSAQQGLKVNQAVSRNIAAGATDKYSISLNDGDYVEVSLSQHGRVNLSIIYPGNCKRIPGSPDGPSKQRVTRVDL